mgnify:CR=1 FL=1
MNSISILIVALFLPGLVATAIIDLLTHHKPWDYFRYGVLSVVLGIVSYLGVQVVLFICQLAFFVFELVFGFPASLHFTVLSFWNVGAVDKISLHPEEIMWGMAFSIPMSILCVFIHERRILYKILSYFRVSSYIGDRSAFLDGLDYLFEESGWSGPTIIQVFYEAENILAVGEIKHYNETDKHHEISLLNATVSTLSGEYLYHTNYLYLCSEIGGIKFVKNIYKSTP